MQPTPAGTERWPLTLHHDGMPDPGDSALDKSLKFHFWSQAFRTFNLLIRAGMWVALGYFAYLAIDALAGRDTTVWASLSLMKSSRGLPWVLVLGFLLWAVGERKLRQKNIKSMEGHIRDLETAFDAKRTSSGLLPTGQTNPRDHHDA